MVPLYNVEYRDNVTTGKKVLDNVTANKSTTANDKVNLFV